MEKQENKRQLSFTTIAGISAASLIGLGSLVGLGAWYSLISSHSTSSSVSSSQNTVESPQIIKKIDKEKVQVYWVDTSGNDIELAPSSITIAQEKSNAKDVLDSAFKRLLAGPTDQQFTTSIPEGTELNNISLEEDGIHIDLSEEFTSGGGSASMTSRVAQVLHTATSVDPGAQVWLEVEGETLEVLGGEGLILDQPLTRKNFRENFEF